jgi:hypothetical protein
MIYAEKITLYGAPQHHKRDFPKVMKSSLFDLVKYWHETFLPRHYQVGAESRYPTMKPRTPGYKAKKREKKRTVRPLVYSGLTEQQTRRFIAVSGTSKSVRGTMVAPWYVREQPTRPGGPALAKEITATATDEEAAMNQKLRELVVGKLRNIRTREVVRL